MKMTSPSTLPPKTTDGLNPFFHHIALLFRMLFTFFVPPIQTDVSVSLTTDSYWLRVQEQVLTGMIRVGSVLGTLTLFLAALPPLRDASIEIFVIDISILCIIWMLSIYRNLAYQLRASLFLFGTYIVSCTELLHYGLSQDASILFAFFSLLALLFFNLRVGVTATLVAVTTIAFVGWQISTGTFTPFAHPSATLSLSTTLTTCMIFVMVVGSVQVGAVVVFAHLHEARQNEYQMRVELEAERDVLEQRVAERTEALVKAHAQALAASRYEAEQKDYFGALHQTALDLFNRRETGDLLQAIVERAAWILSAPYGELMLCEGDELVVHAFTRNQPFLLGDRVHRDEALLSWQAYDTQQPIVVDDYATWEGHRACYDSISLRATADFPIMAGQRCLGVLAMGRAKPEQVFTPEDVQKGRAFSRLAALVVDNAQLYATALHEIAERKQAEQALQQHAEELRAQNLELDAFAHTVAHDLKNPLTSLIGYNQLLRLSYRAMQPNDVDALLTAVDRAGRKMDTIITALLLLASVRQREAIPKSILEMGAVVTEVENRLHHSITANDVIITKPSTWPVSIGYAPWVEEVWTNYVSNAIKYGGTPPHITLGATPVANGSVRFWVQDNGAGLDANQQAQLFTLFKRLHPDHIEGHGLGLSIVQRIVTRLGGDVGLESVPGQGSTFFFTLPGP